MSYRVKLSQFEGPLDLLCHLISAAKIRIEDIFVSEITEQYLSYMQQLDEIDMERASEFMRMAANLIYIKSRSLLPNLKVEEEEEIDPEQEIIERLRQYKIFKEAGEHMKLLEGENLGFYYKYADELFLNTELNLNGLSINDLYQAFIIALANMPDKEEQSDPEVKITRETFSVREKERNILCMFKTRGRVSFSELFNNSSSKLEIAVTFLALLNLVFKQEITIKQTESFKDIEISMPESLNG
ncbi:MAG: segregation/condensation protein A [Eubacteriales bacterium]